MTPKELIEKIQKIADTQPSRSKITASDVSRVVSLTFQELSKLPLAEAFGLFTKMIIAGGKRADAAKAAKRNAKKTKSKK